MLDADLVALPVLILYADMVAPLVLIPGAGLVASSVYTSVCNTRRRQAISSRELAVQTG
jgi:hypothetical protein